MDRLLDPVYSSLLNCTDDERDKKAGLAQCLDPMPGESTGGGISLGKSSASPSTASLFESSSNVMVNVSKPIGNHRSNNSKLASCGKEKGIAQCGEDIGIGSGGVEDGDDVCKGDHKFHSPMFPKAKIGYCGEGRSDGFNATDLRSLISESTGVCASAGFGEQSLITFMEEDGQGSGTNKTPDPKDVVGLVSFERTISGQLYLTQDLYSSGHCTIRTSDLPRFMTAKYRTVPSQLTPFLHVPSTTNYVSPDKKIVVINSDDDNLPCFGSSSKLVRPLEKATSMITNMFLQQLSECFDFDNKKRSNSVKDTLRKDGQRKSTKRGKRVRSSKPSSPMKNVQSKKNKSTSLHISKQAIRSNYEATTQRAVMIDKSALPVITLGWSTMDCNQYGANMSTIAGTIKPFLRNGNIPRKATLILIELVEMVLQWLPGDWAFNLDKVGDEEVIRIRREMIADFKETLGGNRDTEFFRIEGITIVIPLSIGYHKDSLNCFMEGMRSVLSINCQVPLNNKTIPSGPSSKLWIWLNQNGYFESFPCSFILYSRKAVHSYCHKLVLSNQFADKDLVRKCIKWAMIDRVKSVVDYRSRVWNNAAFPNLFKRHAKKRNGSRFRGVFWATPAGYDKTVST